MAEKRQIFLRDAEISQSFCTSVGIKETHHSVGHILLIHGSTQPPAAAPETTRMTSFAETHVSRSERRQPVATRSHLSFILKANN